MARGITLEHLAQRAPGMPQGTAEHYQLSCMVCLNDHSHHSGVELQVEFRDEQEAMSLSWQGAITDDVRRWFRDRDKNVEHGAYAIAFLIIPELVPLVAIEQSAKGDGVDYYLADGAVDDDLLFNHTAHLEVSGIHAESGSNTVDARIAEKRQRVKKIAASSTATTEDLPTYICVVEFSRPKTKVVLA